MKYRIKLYFHTNIEFEVAASTEESAIEQARQLAASNDPEIVGILLSGMQEDDDPDVELIPYK